MGGPQKSVDDAILNEAADWFSLLRSGAATEEDRRRFEAWRNADPRHGEYYEELLATWKDMGELDDLRELASDPDFGKSGPYALNKLANNFSRPFTPRSFAYCGLAACLLIFAAIALSQPAWLLPNVHATRTAETTQIAAPDGSRIDLGPESKIRIAYSDAERHVILKEGEAFFDVSRNDNREFIVITNGAEIRVIGTQFNVHHGPSAVTVSVAEGAVQFRRPKSKTKPSSARAAIDLSTGQQAAAPFNESGLSNVTETAPSAVGAWRNGRLQYKGATLRDVIADANRYSRTPIIIADSSLQNMTMVAAFSTSQIDAMIDGLPEILPLEVDRTSKNRIVLRAAGSASPE